MNGENEIEENVQSAHKFRGRNHVELNDFDSCR